MGTAVDGNDAESKDHTVDGLTLKEATVKKTTRSVVYFTNKYGDAHGDRSHTRPIISSTFR
jgi:hypothetical protein